MLEVWTLIVILGSIAVINLPVLYLYILKEKLSIYLFFFFNITSLILSDQCVFLCYAPSVVKQREVGVYVVVPLFCKMVVPCSC